MTTELDYMEYANDGAAQAAYPSSAPWSIDQQNTTVNEAAALGDVADNERRVAQGFQLSGAFTVIAVEVTRYPFTIGSPTGNWTLRIETDSSDKPSGTLADANASIVVTPPAEGASVKGTFATPFALSASTTYHLVIQCDNQATSNYWTIRYYNAGSVYADGAMSDSQGGVWTAHPTWDLWFKIYVSDNPYLQDYSENTIKQQGSYSLKGIAKQTDSLNETLTKSGLSIDLTSRQTIKFDIYSSRTGANIKISIHDSGGTTTEKTHTQAGAGGWETVTWDISGVSNANKDAIDSIIITIVNADADNTFYIDNMYAESIASNALFFGHNF